MSELSGLLILSPEQLPVDAKGSAQRMIQGQIDGILIFLGIFRQHCRIGVILKIYRQFQCLLQKTQTVVLYLQSMRFQYNPVLLINDTGNRNADPQQFLFRTASLQEFRYLLFTCIQ